MLCPTLKAWVQPPLLSVLLLLVFCLVQSYYLAMVEHALFLALLLGFFLLPELEDGKEAKETLDEGGRRTLPEGARGNGG